jgi:hypothetical protein
MNSELIEKAVSVERGSFLFETFSSPSTEVQKLQDLYMAALSRKPTRTEISTAQRMVKNYRGANGKALAYQDLFWALLNSNEFIFNH